jgi:DNA-binding SARP family transcriptional activator/Tfp pilus assembly protein PilF
MRFRVLGPVEVQVDGGWSSISAPKGRTVLAVLLLRSGEVVSTDQLIDEVWPGSPPAKSVNLISGYVHKLRRLIGDPQGRLLATHSPGYKMLVAADDLDARQFTRLAAEGRQALFAGDSPRAAGLLGEALGLWNGSRALPDVPPSPLVSAESSRLEEARVEALELRITADLSCGREAQVVAELRRLITDHPLREGLWALLMRALYGSGRQAEALEAFAQARDVIADELGVEPSAELRQLHQQLLQADAGSGSFSATKTAAADSPFTALVPAGTPPAGEPDLAEPVPLARTPAAHAVAALGVALPPVAQLPADIADFTGRAGQVASLCDLLTTPHRPDSPGAVVLAAVIGAGGLGKTTLAVHAAHLLREAFPDGQLYAHLVGAGQPVSPAEILARFLRDLGADPARIPVDEEERAAQYRSWLAGRRVLIVLDDARDAAQVRPLLPGSASCAVLVTSRSRMPELAGSRFVDLDVLELSEARSLFTAIIGEERAAAEPAAGDRVLAACAGLPLAIRIAGARLAARGRWTIAAMADRLSDERRRLDELKTGNLAVRACFEVSFSSLPAADLPDAIDPAHAFRLLGVWQGLSIGLPAAAALFGTTVEYAADALEVLVDAQLLQAPAPDRYQFHDLLRAYAADRAVAEEPADLRDAAVRRILAWYLHTVDAVAQMVSPYRYRIPLPDGEPAGPPLTFTSLDQALDWCEMERANLLAATRQAALSGLYEFAWQLPTASLGFFNRRTYWADWVETHQIALASARQIGDRRGEAMVLNNLGIGYARRLTGDAIGCFEQAMDIRREIGDRPGEAQTAANLADTYLRIDRVEEALDLLNRALAIHRQEGHQYGEGVALNNLGEVFLAKGRAEEAVPTLGQARDIFARIGELRGEGYALTNLGEAHLALAEPGAAADCLQRALDVRRALGDRLGEAQTLRDLGQARLAGERPAEARQLLTQSFAIFEDLGDEAQLSAIRRQLASLPA